MKIRTTNHKSLAETFLFPLLLIAGLLLVTGCTETESDTNDNENNENALCMDGAQADCEYDILTFSIAGGDPIEVSINGLPVVAVKGAEKLDAENVDIVDRRGVKFSDILTKAEIGTDMNALPVNCIARDGWDPLRIRLDGDLSKLPTLSFLREFGYVYVGSAGDKDPMYPNMDAKTLMVDFNLTSNDQVPEALGGKIASIGFYRWKMVEKISDSVKGLFELDPTL